MENQGNKNTEDQFGSYIRKAREEMQYSAKQLGDGICSRREIALLESGERLPDKLVTDVLLERLGMGAEDYEHLLNYPDYDRWETRQRILHAITWEEFAQAKKLLNEYYRKYCEKDDSAREQGSPESRLELQFWLTMQTLLERCLGSSRERLEAGYMQALELTVPDAAEQPLAGRALSLKELNLILEVEQYREDGGRLKRYLEVLAYIEAKKLDDVAKAKIYPKAVYFLCRKAASGRYVEGRSAFEYSLGRTLGEEWSDERLLECCNQALEALRDGERMFFLWEILYMREKLLDSLIEHHIIQGESSRENDRRIDQEKNRKLRLALEQVFEEFEVPRETFEFCYLYVLKEVYCINDVIRLRRRMLRMKAQELCEDVCTVKTLRNIENRRTSPQRPVAEKLLEKLGLSKDLTKTEIVTDDPEARELMNHLRKKIIDACYEEAEELLEKLRQKIPLELACNRQVLMNEEVLVKWRQGVISDGEYLEKIREALEITLPFQVFLKEEPKYLTNMEQTCIQNMMQKMNTNSEEFRICLCRFQEIYQPFVENGMHEVVANMHEFIMGNVASILGNRGEYDKSDEIEKIIIRGCLRFHRIGALHGSLYGRWWNCNEREKKGIPMAKKLDRQEELERCIQFARFTREYNDVRFYQKKLKG